MEEAALWEEVVGGNREAFDRIYLQYSAPVRSFVRHYLQDPGAADDLVQETFLQLWKKPNGYNPERGTLKQYLFGIARKRAAQWRRESPPPTAEEIPDVPIEPMSDQTLFRDALQQLDKDQRGLLWLREVEGYSYSELAAILDIPTGTVKSRLFSAREAIRQLWLAGRKE